MTGGREQAILTGKGLWDFIQVGVSSVRHAFAKSYKPGLLLACSNAN